MYQVDRSDLCAAGTFLYLGLQMFAFRRFAFLWYFVIFIAAAVTLSFVISVLVYYTMRINKLNKKSDNI